MIGYDNTNIPQAKYRIEGVTIAVLERDNTTNEALVNITVDTAFGQGTDITWAWRFIGLKKLISDVTGPVIKARIVMDREIFVRVETSTDYRRYYEHDEYSRTFTVESIPDYIPPYNPKDNDWLLWECDSDFPACGDMLVCD